MHGSLQSQLDDDVLIWDVPPTTPRAIPQFAAATAPHEPIARSDYGARRINLPLLALILVAHIVALALSVMLDVVPISLPHSEPIVVTLIKAPAEPLPAQQESPAVATRPVKPLISAPVPIIQAQTPVPAAIFSTPAPVAQEPIVAASPPAAPVTIDDLATKMITIVAPRYPIESRRRKEQGTVHLSLVLDFDGKVAEIRLARSSGFERLDKAALEAVRKWRWAPTVRAGQPVMVHGTVDIPFVLKT